MANQFKINENLAHCHFVLIWNGSQVGIHKKNFRLILIPFRNRAHFFSFSWGWDHNYLYLLNTSFVPHGGRGSQFH